MIKASLRGSSRLRCPDRFGSAWFVEWALGQEHETEWPVAMLPSHALRQVARSLPDTFLGILAEEARHHERDGGSPAKERDSFSLSFWMLSQAMAISLNGVFLPICL
jgi:hypothetical protein